MSRYEKYEAAKRELNKMHLTPQEYEVALRVLCKKLKI